MTISNRPELSNSKNTISEKKFRGMVESTAGIPWVVDFETFQFIYVGPQAEKILGYPIERWYETDFWINQIHPHDRQAAIDYCLNTSKKGQDYHFEYRMMHQDGHSVWILDYVNIVSEDGRPVQRQGFMFDISKDKQAEQTLQQHTALLDAIYRASPDMIFIHDKDGRILDVNNNAVKRFGYTLSEMRKLSVADISSDNECQPLVNQLMQQALRGEEPDVEWLAKDSHNDLFPVEVRLRKLEGGDVAGSPAVIATIRDITTRKRTENAINNIAAGVSAQSGDIFYPQMVKHLATLFDADYAFIGLLDHDNPKIVNTLSVFAHGKVADNISYSLTDTPCDQVVGERTCCHPADVQLHYPKDQRLIDMNVDSYIGSPLFDKDNNPIGLIVVLDSKPMQPNSQLTEYLEIFSARASAELERDNVYQQLKNTQQKLQLHVKQTPIAIIEWDTHFRVTDWNPAAEIIFGYGKQDVLGKPAEELFLAGEKLPLSDLAWHALLKNPDKSPSTHRNITSDGKNITCEWYNTPLIADDNQVIGIASLVTDVTNRINTETELKVYREHLEELIELRTTELTNINKELESFSYSVSHDLRAPLRHIDGFSQILLEDYSQRLDEDGQALIGRIRNNATHMGLIIENLIQLSRVSRNTLRCEPLNLSSMVEEIFEKLQHYDGSRNVTVTIQRDLKTVADHQLTHALLENLIGNAWKYTSKTENAEISFEASNNDQSEPVFCLRDNGAGFDMQYADKLFDVFKRLHSANDFEGTGIGLATVKRITQRHNGKVWAEAETGKGARFYFTFGNNNLNTLDKQ